MMVRQRLGSARGGVLGALALLVISCTPTEPPRAITVSLVGAPPRLIDPGLRSLDPPSAALLAATAQGLVGFDASGRIVPALAERWIETDDGLSLIFRLRPLEWADGSKVTARDVASALKRAMARDGKGSLQRLFAAVDQVIPMTGAVIELRLRSPQPALLALLAQPEMAIFKRTPSQGTGPLGVHSTRAGVIRLRPLAPQMLNADEDITKNDVRVRGEPAPAAVARFVARDAAMVTGGSLVDLPYAQVARVSERELRIDMVSGLLGFGVTANSETLASNAVRRALAMAIDREQLLARFAVRGWRPAYAILPARFEGALAPAALEWVTLPLATRRERARATIAALGQPTVVRLALPAGAGARLLGRAVAADWTRIGVRTQIVAADAPADLRLIDAVAPAATALWYLDRLSCARGLICNPPAEAALTAAFAAATLEARATAISEADAAFANHQPFIPIAAPLRWSLASSQVSGYRANALAVHPLAQLRAMRP